jgi:hypothetical protein
MRYNDPMGHRACGQGMCLEGGGPSVGGSCPSCLRQLVSGLAVTAVGYGAAEGNTRGQAGAKPISSDVGGNTASLMPTPDPDDDSQAGETQSAEDQPLLKANTWQEAQKLLS